MMGGEGGERCLRKVLLMVALGTSGKEKEKIRKRKLSVFFFLTKETPQGEKVDTQKGFQRVVPLKYDLEIWKREKE